MKKTLAVMTAILLATPLLSGKESYFLSHPTLTPDASRIIFCYDTDLWIVSRAGGTALRLTAMEGTETHPRVSPDGQWLAFSTTRHGNADICLMPLQGGEIRQLTLHEGDDYMDSWSWDSRILYFNSNRSNNFTEYQVSIAGETPVRLFGNYFNTIHGVVVHPLTRRYYFTDSWESFRFANRKGYRGEYNPDIKSYYPPTQDYQVHTTYRGKDFSPVIDRNGNIYFISDEYHGEFNLFRLGLNNRTRLTGFPESVRNPQVSADGSAVVFEKGYQVFLYQVAEAATRKVEISVYRDRRLQTDQDFNLKGKISFFDVSADHKKLALVSRGQLFVSDLKGEFIRQLPVGPDRVREVHWLNDHATLLFSQTREGYLNWFTLSAAGSTEKTPVTRDRANNRNLTFSNDRKRAVYYSGRHQVRLLDLDTFKSTVLLEDELWGFNDSLPRFSPDDRFLAFTAYRNFEQDILIYDFTAKKTANITGSGVTETQPFWSPDGRFLFFCADRLRPRFPRGRNDPDLYRLPLLPGVTHFRSREYHKLFQPGDPRKAAGTKKKKKPVQVRIDFKDLLHRWEPLSPVIGRQENPIAIDGPRHTDILFLSGHEGQGPRLYKKTLDPFKKPEMKMIIPVPRGDIQIRQAQNHFYLRVDGRIHTLDLKTVKTAPLDIEYSFTKNLSGEFSQMFFEIWANLEENFYDAEFHGRDWHKIRDRYRKYLPHLQSRTDLRQLISDMLGELNSSHLGFSSRGHEETPYYRQRSLETGLVFSETDPYRVSAILKGSPARNEQSPIEPGHLLVAVNQQPVDPAVNRNRYFSAPFMVEEMELTFRRPDGSTYETRLHPQSYTRQKEQLYDRWQETNQQRVDEWSDGEIAYIHMKNMGTGELEQFLIEMTTEWYQRSALILDLRYNTGGNVHDDVLNFLIQRPYTQWKYRGGALSPQPNFAPSGKPIVLLINEQSLSDAEMTAAGFKALDLGRVIGTETYRWLIFTTGNSLVDGSYYRLPAWGCFTLDGRNLEKTGVTPDIYIKNTFKDRLLSRDPQLKRAVEELLKQIRGPEALQSGETP